MSKPNFTQAIMENTNPVEAFITMPKTQGEAVAPTESKPTPKPLKAGQPERKSARVNMLFYPSVKEALDKLARFDNTSLNDIVNKVMADYVDGRKADVAKIDNLGKGN